MKPRVSVLNLLSLMTVVALVLMVFRLRSERDQEKWLRMEMLKKGGILQVSDPDAVHVVQVSSPGELFTQRWRVYVRKGRQVQLNARFEPRPADDPPAPRLPPNAIVVAVRAASRPISLGPGEHVVSLSFDPYQPSQSRSQTLVMDVVSDSNRRTRELRVERDVKWFSFSGREDITQVEHAKVIAQELRDGRTVSLADGKTFVLCRYRDRMAAMGRKSVGSRDTNMSTRPEAMEVLVWLHPDEG